MSRLTLRLPDTLHRQLESLAHHEAVSLNQYIVFALTRQATVAYTVQVVPEEETRRQQVIYTALLQSLGQASSREVEHTLVERETVEPEKELSHVVERSVRNRIARQRTSV